MNSLPFPPTPVNSTLIYLASPYTHPMPDVQHERAATAARVAGEMIKLGYHVFSPIAHGHTIVQHCNISGSWWQWHNLSLLMLSRCNELWICTIDGFGDSIGVNYEVGKAEEMGIPIKMIDPETLEVTK